MRGMLQLNAAAEHTKYMMYEVNLMKQSVNGERKDHGTINQKAVI